MVQGDHGIDLCRAKGWEDGGGQRDRPRGALLEFVGGVRSECFRIGRHVNRGIQPTEKLHEAAFPITAREEIPRSNAIPVTVATGICGSIRLGCG